MPHTAPQFDLMGRTEPPCRSLQAVRRDVGQTSQTNPQREGDKSMKIRIHETDFEGHPVDCTGEFFFGSTAIAVVEEMKMNPFLNHLSAQEFMGQLLAAIGEKEFSLPEDPAVQRPETWNARITWKSFSSNSESFAFAAIPEAGLSNTHFTQEHAGHTFLHALQRIHLESCSFQNAKRSSSVIASNSLTPSKRF